MPCKSSPCISTRMCRFLRLISLPASKPCGSIRLPFLGAFDALPINDTSGGTGFAFEFLAALQIQRVMDAIQRTV